MPYATTDDLEEFFEGDPMPEHPDRLLALACERVDEMAIGYVYDDLTTEIANRTKGDGSPMTVGDVLKRVTLLQAQYMTEVGDETGARDGMTSMSTGSVSWSKAVGQGNGRPASSRFAPNAVSALRLSGIPFGVYAR